MVALALVALFAQASPAPIAAAAMTLAAPATVTEIDTNKLRGEPVRLAWSADGSEFYVQLAERDRLGAIKSARHYVVSVSSHEVKSVDAEPAWASRYWAWKSGQASPGTGVLKISVDSRQETVRATAAPTGGAMARGGTPDPNAGTTLEDAASAADTAQKKTIYTLKLKNQALGDWVNEPVMPGVNFGWAPAPMNALVFAKREGGPLIVLDEAGRKQELIGARTAVLPAWSPDGKRVAWLERIDKKKFELRTAEISAK
jgi:hypothetical protein